MLNRPLLSLAPVAASLMLILAPHADAGTISLNFSSGNDQNGLPAPTYPLLPSDVAGVAPAANWNNLATNSGSSSTLTDQLGNTVTGASVTYASNGTYETNTNPATSADFKMMHAGIDERGSGFGGPVPASVTVTLPASFGSTYNVYAYFDAVTTNGAVVAGYNIGSQTYWTKDTAAFAGTFVQATGNTEAAATAGSNYALFTNVSGSAFTLTATPGNNNFRAELMGIQIVSVPEPGSAGIVSLGAVGLISFSRRMRRLAQ